MTAMPIKTRMGTMATARTPLTSGWQSAGTRAAWLFNTYAPVIHVGGTGTDAAALQVAIWEALYDTTPDLSKGAFTLLNQTTNAQVTSKGIAILTD